MPIDFKQKRIDFINNWPKSELFPKEKDYKKNATIMQIQQSYLLHILYGILATQSTIKPLVVL